MEKVGASRTYLCWLARRREAAVRRDKLRRLQQVKQRRAFVKRQCYERLMFVVILAATFTNSPERKMWTKERSCHWRDRVNSFTHQEWLENFHMSHDTFLFLCDKLRSAISKEDTNEAIPVEHWLAMTLWFLSTGVDYRTVGHLFGVSRSSVCVVTKHVTTSIVRLLLPKCICIPTGAALQEVVQGFKRNHGFPQCAGVVDGTHIPIVSPHECPADNYNRRG